MIDLANEFYYPESQQATLLSLLDTLNQTIHAASDANGDTFVPTQDIIEKGVIKTCGYQLFFIFYQPEQTIYQPILKFFNF